MDRGRGSTCREGRHGHTAPPSKVRQKCGTSASRSGRRRWRPHRGWDMCPDPRACRGPVAPKDLPAGADTRRVHKRASAPSVVRLPRQDAFERPRVRAVTEADVLSDGERQALVRVAAAAAGAHDLEEVLELAAEEALRAVGAASLSVSRWDREESLLRTLINVGELGPGEERFPRDESYAIVEHPQLERMLEQGQPYFNAVDDPAADPAAVRILRSLAKESDVGVPIVAEGEIWGEVWASTAAGQPAFPWHRRPLPGGDRRPAGGCDRARRAVLPGVESRLRGPAHRPAEPARDRGAPQQGHHAREPARGRADRAPLRRRQPQGGQRLPRTRGRRRGARARGRCAGRSRRGSAGHLRRQALRRRVLRDHRRGRPGRGARASRGHPGVARPAPRARRLPLLRSGRLGRRDADSRAAAAGG